jgi:hypothetical protein
MKVPNWLSWLAVRRPRTGGAAKRIVQPRRLSDDVDDFGAVPKSAIYPVRPGIGLDD